jgi:hypothetical protein
MRGRQGHGGSCRPFILKLLFFLKLFGNPAIRGKRENKQRQGIWGIFAAENIYLPNIEANETDEIGKTGMILPQIKPRLRFLPLARDERERQREGWRNFSGTEVRI